jgi:hypothetical protein
MSIMDYLSPMAKPIADLIMDPTFDSHSEVNEDGAHGRFGFKNGNSEGLYGEGGIGTWTDKDGGVNRGVSVGGGVFKNGQKDTGFTLFGENVGYEVTGGSAQAGITERTTTRADGKKQVTDSIGAQANGAEGSATIGDDDGSLRVGVSGGAGLAARKHMIDIDGDGETEMNGFGLDIGSFSVDVKSDLIADLLKDAPNAPDFGDITDMIQNPGDYEMPSLDDYEMPSVDHLPDLDNYELPDFGDLPSIDEVVDYMPDLSDPFAIPDVIPTPGFLPDFSDLSLPEVPDWVPDIFGGESDGAGGGGGPGVGGGGGAPAAEAELPTGLLDPSDPLMNY